MRQKPLAQPPHPALIGARDRPHDITHNRRSMEAANLLYGVTMEEPGVSKVLPLRFE